MAWCTYCLFSYCSELDLLHLLRREHPSNLDRLAWRRSTGYQSPPYRPAYRPTVRFLPPGRMKAREQIARGIV